MDPERRSPRWQRKLHFEADEAFKGEVLDLSAVGLRVKHRGATSETPGERLYAGTLTLENGAHVRIKVRVVRAEGAELGLEIAEADKTFYDALPRLRRDSREVRLPPTDEKS
jgi:hypothetical protein